MGGTRRVVEVGCPRHFVFSQKGGILLSWQRCKENCWWPLTAFPLKISDNVSSSRSCAEITASSHRGCTVKGKVSTSYEHFQFFFFNFWEFLGLPSYFFGLN